MSLLLPHALTLIALIVLFARERDHDNTLNAIRDVAHAERDFDHQERLRLHAEHYEQMRALHDAYLEQIQQLCQRIQAPEAAVYEHATRGMESPPAVQPDVDQEYWDAHLSKEQLAEALMTQEVDA